MESMPSPCNSGSTYGPYARRHNPFACYADDASSCHDIPYPGSARLIATLNSTSSPDSVWITPNLNNDMLSGSVQRGDAWLKANLAPVLVSAWFTGGNATVIVSMDENVQQSTPGGGQVPLIVISSDARGGGAVAIHGNHYGTLRSIEEAYGLALLAGAQSAGNGHVVKYFD